MENNAKKEKEYKLVVQKFGGTSVGSPEKIRTIAKYVKENYNQPDLKLIIVVSAMDKDTDRLASLSQEICKNPDPRELDQLLRTGECVTAPLLAMALEAIGVSAVSFTADQIGLVSSGKHGEAKIKKIKDKDLILDLLKFKVLVVTGFQGIIEGSGEIATLGRGGSDATAVALAAFLDANVCEIYTDVDGIYCVNPRIVPNAKRLDEVGYEQMYAMAAAGAGVLFDRSVKIAETHRVKLRVLLSPSHGKSDGGTIVKSSGEIEDLEAVAYSRGLAVKKGLACFNVSSVKNVPREAAKIIEYFSCVNIIDFAQVQGDKKTQMSILIESANVQEVLNSITRIAPDVKFDYCEQLVGLTLVDPLMRESLGYGRELLSALGSADVNIEVTASSHQSILTVIKEIDLKKACISIAQKFDLIRDMRFFPCHIIPSSAITVIDETITGLLEDSSVNKKMNQYLPDFIT